MRIMISVPSYWPSQDGVTNITQYLAEGLAVKGHEVFVLTSAGKGGRQVLPEDEQHNGVKIKRMRIYTQWPLKIKGRDERSTKQAYWNHIVAYRPDVLVVVCAQTWTLDWFVPHLNDLQCVTIFYSHGYSLWKNKYDYAKHLCKRNVLGAWGEYKAKRYYDKLYKWIALFDRAIYLSEQSNAVLYAEKYSLTNGRILKNAIDDRFFDSKMYHVQEQKEVLQYLFVANYNHNKNQEMLIRAFAQAKIGKSRLVLVGFEENDYYKHLEEVVREEIGNQQEKEVLFRIHISREEVIETYRNCDVFVCSSKTEIYPVVAHEAAATGMPIISTDVGIYSKITGTYIVNDVEQMQHAMEELYYHSEERVRRGKEAFEWVNNQNCRIQDKVEWLEKDMLLLLDINKKQREESKCSHYQ